MPADRYILEVNNTQQAGNPALVDFDIDVTVTATDEQIAAQILAYVAGTQTVATGTTFGPIRKRAAGSSGSITIAFPTAEYAALRAADPTLPNLTSYSTSVGAGGLTPVGTSILVMEYSAIPGRSTTGRHYLPFPSIALVDSTGRVGGAALTSVLGYYTAYILTGNGIVPPIAPIEDVRPLVVSTKLGTDTPITAPVVQRTFANLRSRRS